MTKWIVILAGPNGAGKSTFVSSGAIHQSIETGSGPAFVVLNADDLARERARGGEVTGEINLKAAQDIEAELYVAVRAGTTIGVETVLSSDKFRKLVSEAKASGYSFMLHYVVLADPGLHVGRVSQRVQEGGHNVDQQKIVERYFRSLEQLPWFAARADEVYIWDNSRVGEVPVILAQKDSDGWKRFEGPNTLHAKIEEAISKAITGPES